MAEPIRAPEPEETATAPVRRTTLRATSGARLPWREGSLAQLTLVRFREFMREPEAVFWTFLFPVVLAIGLGIAFRNKPADVITVGVVRGAVGESVGPQGAAARRHGGRPARIAHGRGEPRDGERHDRPSRVFLRRHA